jgi:hypothetical protein
LADRPGGRHYPAVVSPDSALNRAAAWAIGKVGGHLRVDPAGPDPESWAGEAVTGILEDARAWSRVGGSGIIAPAEFLGRVVGLLLGARLDGAGRRLGLEPALPSTWRSLVVRRLRAHRTLLDLEIRPRAEWVTVKLAVVFGPPIVVEIGLPEGYRVSRVVVDDVPLEAARAVFTAAGEHEVTLYLAEAPET